MKQQDIVKDIGPQDWKKEVVNTGQPTLVDFWAPWCGPCRMVSPTIDEIASEKKFDIKFVKVNVDQNSSIAAAYGIQSIPTIAILKNGKIIDAVVGALSKKSLEEFIQKTITNI